MSTTTILYDDRVTTLPDAERRGEALWLNATQLQTATGWKLESEGLCRGDACVRVDAAWRDDAGRIDLCAFARHMEQPLTRDGEVWAFGAARSRRCDACAV